MSARPHSNQYDVIVVGAGPAGSLTAYHLARAGVRVALLDAKLFPREKPCGGGVQQRASTRIPFDWCDVARTTLRNVTLSFRLGNPLTRCYAEPLVYSVLRSEFDQHLMTVAQKAGAAIILGAKVVAVSPNDNGLVQVQTENEIFRARALVGADGANSIVSRELNARSTYFWQAGLYCEIPQESVNADVLDPASMRIDWGTLPSGYAWIFPKNGYVNVGVGCPSSLGRLLRPYLKRFLSSERLVPPGVLAKLKFAGHQLPTLTRRTKVASGPILLVGDAAGLVEPFTGDGISYACHSAEIASGVILEGLQQSLVDLASYQARLWSEVGAELIWARRLLSFAVAFPRSIYRMFDRNEQIWETFCKVLRGEESFRRLTSAVLGPLSMVRAPVQFLLEQYERRKLSGALSKGLPATD